jgi:hypothetical protein
MSVAAASGCGGASGGSGVAGGSIKAVGGAVPAEVLGLKTAEENVHEALASVRRTYLDATSVYSFRADDLLQATLQVSRFIDTARYQTDKFRRSLVNQIGSSKPNLVQVGDRQVFLTSGTGQRIAVWFRGRFMFVLATREDFRKPRTLLRNMLGLQP